jgi:hypothetical protein
VYFGVWYSNYYLFSFIHFQLFLFFRFIHFLPLIATEYYLFQQSQYQHLLMIWKNAMNILR